MLLGIHACARFEALPYVRSNAYLAGVHHLIVVTVNLVATLKALPGDTDHELLSHAAEWTEGIEGPYVKMSVAVGHEGHNPQTIRYKGLCTVFVF